MALQAKGRGWVYWAFNAPRVTVSLTWLYVVPNFRHILHVCSAGKLGKTSRIGEHTFWQESVSVRPVVSRMHIRNGIACLGNLFVGAIHAKLDAIGTPIIRHFRTIAWIKIYQMIPGGLSIAYSGLRSDKPLDRCHITRWLELKCTFSAPAKVTRSRCSPLLRARKDRGIRFVSRRHVSVCTR